ncbi:hypothetical protein QBC38DRAFT_421326 [Podospora fimiseda]|uniref:Uncharacterized protein n=1 Tax=Podospora fimiseda TaxID=252190 RepID=A0AAN7BL42_9PEZI|nr:hypothetical protein QBC38DRAFT_421326 [Podospora fimiseda]
MDASTPPRDHLSRLPDELLLIISDHLKNKMEHLYRLVQVSHRFNSIFSRRMLDRALHVPKLAMQIIFHATEAGNHDMLKYALERGANPNCVYHSPILRSRYLNAVPPDRPRKTICPGLLGLQDNYRQALRVEGYSDGICHSSYQADLDRIFRRRAELGLFQDPTSNFQYQYMAIKFMHHMDGRKLREKESEVAEIREAASQTKDIRRRMVGNRPWQWFPIHIAAQRGDNVAVDMLLRFGANVNALSSGLCDCDSPVRLRAYCGQPLWTPLHVAICHGQIDTISLLLEQGASR